MKKIIAMFLALCLLIFVLPGCGNDAKPDDSKPADQADTSVKPEFLAEAQGWGYYVDEDGKNICRMKTNDSNDSSAILSYEPLLESDGHSVISLSVIDELLFFRVGFTLYRYDMETESLTKVYSDARTMDILDKDIYFLGREFTIYKMNAYDDQATAILESDTNEFAKADWKNVHMYFIFVNDVMYYYKRAHCKMNLQ